MPRYPECKVPIIYLSSHQCTDTEYLQLKFDLNISFINKKRNVKKDVATHMESLAYTASKNVKNIQLENFHEFFILIHFQIMFLTLKILHIKT